MAVDRRLIAALALLPALAVLPAARADDAPPPRGEWVRCEPGTDACRDRIVFVPPDLPVDEPVPLVVHLHGCVEGAENAEAASRWNELAADPAHPFIVVYPSEALVGGDEVAGTVNGVQGDGNSTCWNGYHPTTWERGAPELEAIVNTTRDVAAAYDIDPNRVYVAGMSSGGIMAVVMAATYPDVFAAAGIFAGCPFAACSDGSGQLAFDAMGEHARAVPMLVAVGSADHLLGVNNNRAIVNEWLGVADLADDGAMNLTVDRTPASTDDSNGLDPSDLDTVGSQTDICARPLRASFCYGGALGWADYPYTVEHYDDAAGAPLVDFWLVHGLGHAYPAGPADADFTDTHGPWITAAMWDFFTAHPMG